MRLGAPYTADPRVAVAVPKKDIRHIGLGDAAEDSPKRYPTGAIPQLANGVSCHRQPPSLGRGPRDVQVACVSYEKHNLVHDFKSTCNPSKRVQDVAHYIVSKATSHGIDGRKEELPRLPDVMRCRVLPLLVRLEDSEICNFGQGLLYLKG